MQHDLEKEIALLVRAHEEEIGNVDRKATDQIGRAYGGVVRASKGKWVERLTEHVIYLAWLELGGNIARINVNSSRHKIPMRQEYVQALDKEVREYILTSIGEYSYPAQVDKQVFVDGQFVMGIECKAYTENAMLKRILVDFHLLKSAFPDISSYLFQLESQLGGDYREHNAVTYGSASSHTLMSYFPDVDLQIFTFLGGERKVDRPIHKPEFYKPLEKERVTAALELLTEDLVQYI